MGGSIIVRGGRAAVIFDLYGTLADIEVDERSDVFWNALASDFFADRPSVSAERIKHTYYEVLERCARGGEEGFLFDQVLSELLHEFRIDPSEEVLAGFAECFRKHSIVHLAKKDYTDQLLRMIADAGYGLGLISNTEASLTRYDLQALGLECAFDQIILSSRFGFKKPDPRIFTSMLNRLGIPPESAVYVGDNFHDDIVGGYASGIDTVFLTSDPERLRTRIEERYHGKVVCANLTLSAIISALKEFGIKLSRDPEVTSAA